jgi:hypothetical protein
MLWNKEAIPGLGMALLLSELGFVKINKVRGLNKLYLPNSTDLGSNAIYFI